MQHIVRRSAALLAVPVLSLSALVVTTAPATAAPDPGPAEAAATWLETQLTDGIVYNEQFLFDDLGLTADIGLALAAYGGHDATVEEIVTAVEPRAYDEWYTYTDAGVTTLYAGSLAKAAYFADAAGADPTDFGGHDLIEMLEGTVSIAPPTTGRVQDVNNEFGDTNTFGQAYAAQVLFTEESPAATPVLAFLLEQQCSEGWFRLDFAARDAADQTCEGDPTSKADTDATAIALAAMMAMHDDALVPAIGKAEAWLLSTQYPNGSWDGRQNSPESNANSTALVGSVLGALGDTDEAQDAAAYVRAHQLANVGECAPFQTVDLGAVAWNDEVRSAIKGGIDPTLQDQARRATAGALAVLPLAEAAGETHVLSAPDYVKGGTRPEVGVIGAAPGEALCAKKLPAGAGTFGWADLNGEAHLKVHVPGKTQTNRVRVWSADGVLGTAEINALGPAKLKVAVASERVAGGKKQTITVRGLEPGEFASVKIDWPGGGSGAGAGGQANNQGVFKTTVKVPNGPGSAHVKAFGQYKNRKGSTSFTVTR